MMHQNLQKHSQIYELQVSLAQDRAQKPLKISELQPHLVRDHHVPKPAKTFTNI